MRISYCIDLWGGKDCGNTNVIILKDGPVVSKGLDEEFVIERAGGDLKIDQLR